MSVLTLDSPVQFVSGIGPKLALKFKRLQVENARDLLMLLPRRYDDLSKLKTLSELVAGETAVVKAKIWEKHARRAKTGRRLVEAVLADESGTVPAIWYNQPYVLTSLKDDTEYLFAGKVGLWNGALVLEAPTFELVSDDPKHMGKIVPVYPETEGLSSRTIRNAIDKALPLIEQLPEPEIESLSLRGAEATRQSEMVSYRAALRELHNPTDQTALSAARHTIGFTEMLVWELKALTLKQSYLQSKSTAVAYDVEFVRGLVAQLNFPLTKTQKKSLHEALTDLARPTPMNRLLEGDVGSGKTVVAVLAGLMTTHSGGQVALMVPTEILARQHITKQAEFIRANGAEPLLLLSKEAIYRGSKITPTAARKLIESGEANFIIGTHALVQESVVWHDLRLAIVDEQHRFGVNQRAKLREENRGKMPHLLTMTATPIPRTLALTLFGDLDLSIITELPPGRVRIKTEIGWSAAKRQEIYEFMREQIRAGRQAFVVVPLIDESDKVEAKAVKLEHERLDREIFPELKVGLLHGQLKSAGKELVMSDFADGKTQVLVATPVIEVGIDIPNATIMMIESAERFGLAQLHQFRGRVGRGEHESHCFVMPGLINDQIKQRLITFANLSDGFKLAEADLKLRGPGEVFGFKQSGLPDFQAASLTDTKLIYEAREAAEQLLSDDPDLKAHPVIKQQVQSSPFTTLD